MEQNQKGLILGLGGALGAALLVIAFLLGRTTAPPPATVFVGTPVAPPTTVAGAAIRADVSEAAAAPESGAPESAAPASAAPSAPVQMPTFRDELVPAPVPLEEPVKVPTVPSTDRAAVQAYFAQIDQAGDMGAGDPQVFAQSMMKSVSSGDFSSFDELVTKARAQRDRVRGLTPPLSCAAHHRLAVTLADESMNMLTKMREALAKGDTAALMTMATSGRDLETQANQLKSMGDALKKRAGL